MENIKFSVLTDNLSKILKLPLIATCSESVTDQASLTCRMESQNMAHSLLYWISNANYVKSVNNCHHGVTPSRADTALAEILKMVRSVDQGMMPIEKFRLDTRLLLYL